MKRLAQMTLRRVVCCDFGRWDVWCMLEGGPEEDEDGRHNKVADQNEAVEARFHVDFRTTERESGDGEADS